MNVASVPSADVDTVRLCFLVNTRNASGRSVGGGSMMGSTVAGFVAWGSPAGGGTLSGGIMGCAGVANAGEEEKLSEAG